MADDILATEGKEGLDILNKVSDTCKVNYNACAPLSPVYIEKAQAVILSTAVKAGLVAGFSAGHGIMLCRLPSRGPRAVPEWSAPIFLKLKFGELGICLGVERVQTFMVCMGNKLLRQLLKGGHGMIGVDQSAVIGAPQIERRSDVITTSATEADVVSVSHSSGVMIDFSLAGGNLTIDQAKMARAYGEGVTADQVAAGGVPPAPALEALYDRLNSFTSDIRSRMSVGRTTASLERMTMGYDPDQRVVTEAGAVVPQAEAESGPAAAKVSHWGPEAKPPVTAQRLGGGTLDQAYVGQADHFGINVGLARRSAEMRIRDRDLEEITPAGATAAMPAGASGDLPPGAKVLPGLATATTTATYRAEA